MNVKQYSHGTLIIDGLKKAPKEPEPMEAEQADVETKETKPEPVSKKEK